VATLEPGDVDSAAEIVRRTLSAGLARSSTERPGRPLANEVLDLVVSQTLLPVLVAVVSTRLSDVLKDRRLKRLKRADAEAEARKLVGTDLRKPEQVRDPSVLVELRALLAPLGFSDEDVEAMIELVRQEVARRPDGPPSYRRPHE
jgi:hypothetical protein